MFSVNDVVSEKMAEFNKILRMRTKDSWAGYNVSRGVGNRLVQGRESLTFRGHVQEDDFPDLRDMARVLEGTGFRLSDVSLDQYVYDSDADSFKPYVGRVERNRGLSHFSFGMKRDLLPLSVRQR